MQSKAFDSIRGVLIIVFSLFLAFDFKIVNLVLIALIILSLVDYTKSKKLIRTFYEENKRFISVYFLFVGYQLTIATIGHDLGDRRTGLLFLSLLIPVVLTLSNQLNTILKSFIGALTLVVLLGIVHLTNYYLSSEYFVLTVGGHIDKLLIVARPFLSYMLAIGSFISMYLYQREVKYRIVYLLLPFIYSAYIVFIGNRIQVLSLLMVLVLYFICYLKRGIWYKIGGICLVFICFAGIFSLSDTLQSRFELESLNSRNILDNLSHKEPRVEIWKCAYGVVKEESFDPFFGLKNKRVLENKMESCYVTKTVDNPMHQYFLEAKFDTHNQFLEYYVLTGIFGVIGFCILFFVLGLRAKDYFIPMAILVLLFNFNLVENLLDTQLGTYMVGFSFFLIFSFSRQTFSK